MAGLTSNAPLSKFLRLFSAQALPSSSPTMRKTQRAGSSTADMESFEPFLRSTEVIDWSQPAVQARGEELAAGCTGPLEVARKCFEWVRDQIQHSSDYRRNPVTCSASDVLREGTGYCYAKSHLLAALLRANRIPAGFCYQRLSVHD